MSSGADVTRGAGPSSAATAARDNLPKPLTRFIGREGVVEEPQGLLAESRLLTLTGDGGVGKTRLALQLAASVRDAFPDGVWLVDLTPVNDPAAFVSVVAGVLGVREEPGRPLATTLAMAHRSAQLLLVLDNCEHLVGECAALAETVLEGCPDVRILASSRQPLRLAGETA